jgi:nitrogen fixation/metabolism regulation signal transduction histidine kinase
MFMGTSHWSSLALPPPSAPPELLPELLPLEPELPPLLPELPPLPPELPPLLPELPPLLPPLPEPLPVPLSAVPPSSGDEVGEELEHPAAQTAAANTDTKAAWLERMRQVYAASPLRAHRPAAAYARGVVSVLGKTERRLALVILLTALLPLLAALWVAVALMDFAGSAGLRPEVSQQLERGIDLYKTYIRTVKADIDHQADALAGDAALREAAARHDKAATQAALDALFPRYDQLVSLTVEDEDARTLATHDRGKPVDEATERTRPVKRSLVDTEGTSTLIAVFAFDRRYEQELVQAGQVHDAYAQLIKEGPHFYAGYYKAFAAILFITVVLTVFAGFALARPFTRRIQQMGSAINEVAGGNLDVRVPEVGNDELTDLATVFNRMLTDMQQSRARIEYLQRIGAWQEMAQRLAHEIKNPLTPIQLAVQECHRKYGGDDPRFRALLDTTLEIVEEEVGTLRRLVGNFSSFARLPHAELKDASLRDFLRECSEQLGHLGAPLTEEGSEDLIVAPDVTIRWEVPHEDLEAAIDKQMLRRVLVNLVRNAVQAIRAAKHDVDTRGRVVVRADKRPDGVDLIVEDDGPGVPESSRDRVFDPYFTTKAEGTGLGLAIVKKIVVEHNGAIAVRESDALGGAAFVVSLPLPHSLAIAVAQREGSGAVVVPPPVSSKPASKRPTA